MIQSMTAFATEQGHAETANWTWELRSVNGRGLDVKLRLPDGFASLEAAIRSKLGENVTRGNVTVGLRIQRVQAEGSVQIDQDRLDTVLGALDQVQERAFAKGVTLGQPTAADVLAQRGVLIAVQADTGDDLQAPLLESFEKTLEDFCSMRVAEGAALEDVLEAQVNEIEALTEEAAQAANARLEQVRNNLNAALARVMSEAAGADPDRVAQELALLAVKADITEEIDRLGAHVAAARALLSSDGPVGRKLDFLMQEFNREANTLCSKSQDTALTRIGLALKAVIDQMREQVQNVE